jgi:HlyD family secretion protein
MTVSVDIEVARRPRAVIVSLGSVHEADSAAPWVLRVDGRRAVRVPIRLGLRTGGVAEVIEGLGEGDQLVPAATAVAQGTRVRAAPRALLPD